MSNVYVDLIEEIRTRIQTAITAESITLKRVIIGLRHEANAGDQMPLLSIKLGGFNEGFGQIGGKVRYAEEVRLNCLYLYDTTYDSPVANNTLYKLTGTTGFLYDLTKILDVLDKKVDGSTIDPRFLTNSRGSLHIEMGEFRELSETIFQIEFDLVLPSKEFNIGGRNY